MNKMSRQEVYITSTVRSAVGKLNGALNRVDQEEFGAAVLSAAIERAHVQSEWIDEVIISENYRTGKTASNISRVLGIRAGLPIHIPGYTVNMHCGGALKSLMLAAQAIRAGDAQAILAGGIEMMSQAAYFLPDMRWGGKVGNHTIRDPLAILDPIAGMTMGETAEKIAKDFEISRDEQDHFALQSQKKAAHALEKKLFQEEIVSVTIKGPKGQEFVFDLDEHPRPQTTYEGLQKLKPVFVKDGTVTAGNSSGMNDGASAAVLVSGEMVSKHSLRPLARVVSYASIGVEPSIMGTGPVPATRLALQRAGLSLADMDLIELNEAFASMCIYFIREMNPDLEKLNVNGGAIALGHPIAATGGILLTKLIHELRRRHGRYGLVTMCIGGGQGVAMIVDAQV
jgi:acetyl-CoA C-acetyltransferase